MLCLKPAGFDWTLFFCGGGGEVDLRLLTGDFSFCLICDRDRRLRTGDNDFLFLDDREEDSLDVDLERRLEVERERERRHLPRDLERFHRERDLELLRAAGDLEKERLLFLERERLFGDPDLELEWERFLCNEDFA